MAFDLCRCNGMTEYSRSATQTKDGKSIFDEGTKMPSFWKGSLTNSILFQGVSNVADV